VPKSARHVGERRRPSQVEALPQADPEAAENIHSSLVSIPSAMLFLGNACLSYRVCVFLLRVCLLRSLCPLTLWFSVFFGFSVIAFLCSRFEDIWCSSYALFILVFFFRRQLVLFLSCFRLVLYLFSVACLLFRLCVFA